MPGRAKLLLQAAAVALVAALVALLGWQVFHTERPRGLVAAIKRGEMPAAPPLDLPALEGHGRIRLADLRGKAVVVNFWASWCEPCKEEAPMLERAWKDNRDRDVVVVGVNAQDFRSEARRFVERYGITYPIAHDGPGSSVGRYGLTGFPETYWVDRRGRLVAHVIGQFSERELETYIDRALGSR